MTADKLITEIAEAMPNRLEYLERRANLSGLTEAERFAVDHAFAARRAHFASPEWQAKLLRA